MIRLFNIFILLTLTISPVSADNFPEIEGWKPVSEVVEYVPDNLWEYINGAADQFIDYGFKNLRVQEVQHDTVILSIDIYDMESAISAFGIYKTESRGVEPKLKIGGQSVVTPPAQGLMVKTKYYIKINTIEGKLTMKAGKRILKQLAASIPGLNKLPPELSFLPLKNQIEGTVGFVKSGYLGLTELKNCLFASYRLVENHEFQIFTIIPEDNAQINEFYRKITKEWKETHLDGNPLYYKKVPYQGLVGITMMPDGLFGTTNAKNESVLREQFEIMMIP